MTFSESASCLQRLNSPRFYIPAILAGCLFIVPLVYSNPIFLELMILIYFYAYLTTSWNLLGGFAGQLSLGHTAFTGIGAYTSTILFISFGLTPWLGMLLGGVFAAIIAITIGYPCFRLKGAYFALSTLACVETLRLVVENTNSIFGMKVGGPRGIELPLKGHSLISFQFLDKVYYYYIILAMMLIALLISYMISKSKLGYCLSAIRNDVDAAQSLGVNVSWCRSQAAILSAFLTAIGGTFYAQLILFIDPASIISGYLSLEIVLIAIVGGRGTLMGPILGSFFLIPISELTRIYLGGSYMGVHLIVFGGILMLVILFLPQGINGLVSEYYFGLIGRLEKRRGELIKDGTF